MANVAPFVLPDANSWLARIYIYGLKKTYTRVPEQENFCHFWRVILFWAPIEWLYQTQRGWRGLLRPFQVFSLLIFAAALFVLTLIAAEGTGGGFVVLVCYGLVGIFGATAFWEDELEQRTSGLRFGLLFSWVWGSLLLAIVVLVLLVMAIGHLLKMTFPGRESRVKKADKPSKTWEFVGRLIAQLHERVCPPVIFEFNLYEAVWGRKEPLPYRELEEDSE
ncbi:MAG: hypothetical protein AAB486_02700 [Patescibacteria group bacterium]